MRIGFRVFGLGKPARLLADVVIPEDPESSRLMDYARYVNCVFKGIKTVIYNPEDGAEFASFMEKIRDSEQIRHAVEGHYRGEAPRGYASWRMYPNDPSVTAQKS